MHQKHQLTILDALSTQQSSFICKKTSEEAKYLKKISPAYRRHRVLITF